MAGTMEKSLDRKIAHILADPSCKDFILADAKDADMAKGMAAPGQSPEQHSQEGRFRSLAEYRELMRQNVRQGLLDIMLMSASSNYQLAIVERLFDNSHITPAARANDTTDIHFVMGGNYPQSPSRPFRSATIDHIMCGKVDCSDAERRLGADLGLYSLTFNNNLDTDLDILKEYRDFRIEAERKGFRHFLEFFDPNACNEHCPADTGRFLNDLIARTLAGVVGKGRPIFLKIPYHGPAAMEQLASYDRTLLPGILGGAAGTTFDAFDQLREARKYGARAALYGRMINQAENQQIFIQHLRWLADGDLDDAAQAVRSYHGALQQVGIRPHRSLDDDLKATRRGTNYGSKSVAVDGGRKAPAAGAVKAAPAGKTAAAGNGAAATPDFSKMSGAEKVQWNLNRWRQVLD